jgi:hypothetical protein
MLVKPTEEELYLKIRHYVRHLALKFCEKYPQLDVDELISDSQEELLYAIRKFDPSRGSITTWVNRNLWRHWSGKLRSGTWRRQLSKQVAATLKYEPANKPLFELTTFLWELSRPAQEAVQIMLDAGIGGKEPLQKQLRELGWPTIRIKRVFEEIGDALHG